MPECGCHAMQYPRRGETFLKTRLKIIIQNRHFYKRLESICMIRYTYDLDDICWKL